MRVEGEVGLDAMVWLTASPEARAAVALAHALPGSDWLVNMGDRARVRVRGRTAEFEPRVGPHWTGLVTGRVVDGDEVAGDARFRPYARDVPAPPMHLESCWFALDDDGRVGCFERDQLGAAPVKRCWGPRPAPAFASDEAHERIAHLDGHHAAPHPPTRTFTFVTDGEKLAHELERAAPRGASRRWALSHHDGRALITMGAATPGADEALPPTFIGWLHARGLCFGCARGSMRDPRVRGVFVYRHLGRERAAPYERVEEPTRPWSAEECAKQLGLHVAALRASVLPVRFTSKDRIQPIEYARCTWSETVPWEAESGERHGRAAGLRGR